MTRVLTIQELQQLIPETFQLEGKNFSDMKILLQAIIEHTEKSGVYEFVQYIQSKPSLFIVRDKPVGRQPAQPYNSVPEVQFETTKKGKIKTKISEPVQEEQQMSNNLTVNDTGLFPETKLPW